LIRSVGVDGYCAEGWEKCFFNIGAKACYASRLAGSDVGNVSFNDWWLSTLRSQNQTVKRFHTPGRHCQDIFDSSYSAR